MGIYQSVPESNCVREWNGIYLQKQINFVWCNMLWGNAIFIIIKSQEKCSYDSEVLISVHRPRIECIKPRHEFSCNSKPSEYFLCLPLLGVENWLQLFIFPFLNEGLHILKAQVRFQDIMQIHSPLLYQSFCQTLKFISTSNLCKNTNRPFIIIKTAQQNNTVQAS